MTSPDGAEVGRAAAAGEHRPGPLPDQLARTATASAPPSTTTRKPRRPQRPHQPLLPGDVRPAARPGRPSTASRSTTAADRGQEPGPGPRLPGREAARLPEGPAVRRRGPAGHPLPDQQGLRSRARRTARAPGTRPAGPATQWEHPPFTDLGPQLRPRLAVHRGGRHLADHRPDRAGPAAATAPAARWCCGPAATRARPGRR